MSQSAVVLVAGSSGGWGRGIPQSCAHAGFSVSIHFAGNEAAARETVALCQPLATNPEQKFIPVRGNLGEIMASEWKLHFYEFALLIYREARRLRDYKFFITA